MGPNEPVILVTFYAFLEFFKAYAWNVIAIVVIGAFLWVNVEPYLYDWLYDRKNKKDLLDTLSPDRVESLMSAHDRARQKMQEEYDQKVKKQKNASSEVNEFAALVRDVPSSSDTIKTETKPKTASKTTKFKSDFNPLLGRASFDPPRYRPGTSRYNPSRGGG